MKTIYAFLLVAFMGLMTNQVNAAIDVYMRIREVATGNLITGESTAQNFAGWTELKGYGSSLSFPINIGSGSTGVGSGRPDLDTFQFQVPLSSISLPLSKNLLAGTRLEIDIYFVKTTGTTSSCQCAFYKIHMEDVFVSNISEGYDVENIAQQISFKPLKIAWAYYKQTATGTYPTAPTNQAGWDFSRNIAYSYSF